MGMLARRGVATVGSLAAALVATGIPGRTWHVALTSWRGLPLVPAFVPRVGHGLMLRPAARAGLTSVASSPEQFAITRELLKAQDDKTSNAVIQCLQDDQCFMELAAKELEGILRRDAEDGRKLSAGVAEAIEKGLLPGDLDPPPYAQIDASGKTADEVASEIIAKLPEDSGCVVVLVGLSGTGKGTTADKIKKRVENAVVWSNGNCFRSLTLLAVKHCEDILGLDGFDAACLTSENLAAWSKMIEFVVDDNKFDIRISGLGIDVRVSETANTLLKEPRVSRNIPAVAEKSQGEVVRFASEAVQRMGEAGTVVIVEGREQTLNFIPSPYRFCLVLSDTSVLGKRRAAQRIAAAAATRLVEAADVQGAIRAAMLELTSAA